MQLSFVRPSVCPSGRWCGPGGQEILISCCTVSGPAVSSSCAAARHSAANAGSATLSADVES